MFRSHRGIALVTALVAVLIVAAILSIITASVISELRSSSTTRVRDQLVQAADSLSERARLQLVTEYKTRRVSVPTFIQDMATSPMSASADLGDGISGSWRVIRTSPPGAEYGWIEVAATVRRGADSQTVIRRISFGQNDVFKLAMLSETTNCMYCHLRVNGDVGALRHHRPGWGNEGGNENSGRGSLIRGNLYAARTITRDGASRNQAGQLVRGNHWDPWLRSNIDSYRINGSLVTGEVEENSTNAALPQDTDGDGIPDFPPIRREVARASARGSISGGTIVALSRNQVLNATTMVSGVVSGISRVHNGNLVLIGTPTNPIVIDKDVYVEGDVVIKGVVKGRGAIYAGRNIYIAGNLTYANPPSKPGQGVCAGVSDPDECARRNIRAGRDELRLAARGNTIVGDYTERDAAGNLLPFDLRQSADFYRRQFGLWSTRHYDSLTGDELVLRGGRYYNVEGEEVPASRVLSRGNHTDPRREAYSYSMRPGWIDSGGNFNSWISDQFYRDVLLGSQNLAYNTWRWDFSAAQGTVAQRDQIRSELQRARIPPGTANTIACRLAGLAAGQNGCPGSLPNAGDILDDRGRVVGRYHLSGQRLHVMRDEALSYETQVTRVDAFLYSNFRIAGKTSMLGMAINGGLVAKELGILAPGRQAAEWWMGSRYSFLSSDTDSRRGCNAPDQPYYVEGSENCLLTVNYDHRLRNGGYGFNLVQGNPGQTVAWRLSADPGERVP